MGKKLIFSCGLCLTYTSVSLIIIGQKCPFNTPLTHFPTFHFLFPTQFHFISILLFISFYQYQTHFHLLYRYQTHFKKKKKRNRRREVQMFNEGSSNYFARYNNFILLNSYLFLNIFEYEVNLILFVSFFFPFILKYDVDCFNLVLI